VVRAVIIETAPFRREQHVCVYVMMMMVAVVNVRLF